MQAMPHEEPEESVDELMQLQEAVARHIDALDERDRWIVNACISEGKSLQTIAKELGYTKTHVWRLRNQAFEKLRKSMSSDTQIISRIKDSTTWDQSAMKWVNYLAHEYIMTHTVKYEPQRTINEMWYFTHKNDTRSLEFLFKEMAGFGIDQMRLREIWDSGHMWSVLCKKHNDYGCEGINRFGEMGIIIRLSDKVERYLHLVERQAMNESTDDTLLDIVGYCVVALMYLDGTFQLPLGENYDGLSGHE